MKLLFDANLSPALVGLLRREFPNSAHVFDYNLLDDGEIWRFAAHQRFVIVSKDADFFAMSTLYGAPPKVVWLKVGNAGTPTIAALLKEKAQVVSAFDGDAEASLFILRW